MRLLAPAAAHAQPVATEDRGLRMFTGFRSRPYTEMGKSEVQYEQRAFVSGTYRIVGGLDMGLGLPAVRFRPAPIGPANPYLVTFWHIAHDPVWLSTVTFVDAPVFQNTRWRTELGLDANIRSLPPFEIFTGLRAVWPLVHPVEGLLVSNSGVIWRAFETFAFGPEMRLRWTRTGYDEYAVGTRIRWEFRRNDRPFAVWFVSLTFPRAQLDDRRMDLLTYITWYWRI